MEERRRSFRVRRPLLLAFYHPSGKKYVVNLIDLNEEGLRFLSPVSFTEGQELPILLKPPSRPDKWQEFKAIVLESKDITKFPGAFVTGFRTRLKFTFVPEDSASFLKDYCIFASKQDQALERIYEKHLGILEKDFEKRGSVRIPKPLIVMYAESRDLNIPEWDVSVIRNISQNGALFTTKLLYKASTHLVLLLKVPSKPFDWLNFNAKVIESHKLKKDYELLIGEPILLG